jgi:hypothetical protein
LLGQILADFEGAALDTAGVQLRENLDDFHLRVVLFFLTTDCTDGHGYFLGDGFWMEGCGVLVSVFICVICGSVFLTTGGHGFYWRSFRVTRLMPSFAYLKLRSRPVSRPVIFR